MAYYWDNNGVSNDSLLSSLEQLDSFMPELLFSSSKNISRIVS